MKTLHFSPGFSQGPDPRRGRRWEGGLRAARAPGLRELRLLGRPSPGHGGGRSWAARRRAQSRVSLTPAPRPPRRRLASPLRGVGDCSSEFKGYERHRQRLLPLLHTPGLRASFLGDRETALRGAGGGAGAAGEETRGCRSPARNHSLPLPFCLPLLPSPLALAP